MSKKKEKLEIIESVCPGCGKPVEGHKCRFCGCQKTINDVSGNVLWMRNGRLVKGFKDEKMAYVQMAIRNNIPQEQWPKQFREGSK